MAVISGAFTSVEVLNKHNNNNSYNNNGYFYVLFLRRARSPFIKKLQRCEHRIRRKKNRLKALCMMQINT